MRKPGLIVVLGGLLTTLLLSACGADVGASASPSAPPPSEAASTPSAVATPGELPIAGGVELSAGNYSLSEFPVGITFEIPPFEPPAVWIACSPAPVEQGVCTISSGRSAPGAALTFQIVDNVVAECAELETAELLDPPVGPSVDDLVTAISSLEGYEATDPVDITVSGFEGKEFTLTSVTDGCGGTWATSDRTTGMGTGEINSLRAIDVDGVRVLIAGAYHPDTPEADAAAVKQAMDSVQIEP